MSACPISERMLKELLAQDVIVADYHNVSFTQKKDGPIEKVETIRHDFPNEDGQYLQTFITITVMNGERKMEFGVRLSPSTKLWQSSNALEDAHHTDDDTTSLTHPLYDLMFKIAKKIGSLV